VRKDPSQEFILSPSTPLRINSAEGLRTSFERKDIPAATYVNNQFIVAREKEFRSHGQPKDRP
jgi:hypothetical protein